MSIIQVDNLSKKYTLRHEAGSYITLRDRLAHPLKSIKNKLTTKKEEFWALKDVSFDVEEGEVLGIIGSNGSGKSTLLKILSRITPPTTGSATIRGTISSLLEVGTGFHPELTGKENIFLSSVILGMTKKEIDKKFDEIVAFSGVERFLDTPVKYYSSGMAVRLGFAVAAHLDSKILIIDEVLAVGDLEFQKKCLKKMDEVTKNSGRTILFVSHDMAAVSRLCSRSVLLNKGRVEAIGNSEDIINLYAKSNDNSGRILNENLANKLVNITEVKIKSQFGEESSDLNIAEKFFVEVWYNIQEDLIENNSVNLVFFGANNEIVLQIYDVDTNPNYYNNRAAGIYCSKFELPANIFNYHQYRLAIYCGVNPKYGSLLDKAKRYDYLENIFINFHQLNNFAAKFYWGGRAGSVLLKTNCEIVKL
jgi:lipopolysaccharide transport system ATP-binding protein